MQKYKVNVSRDEYGYITVEANSKEEAIELVNSGEWSEDDYYVKGGGVIAESAEPIE